jgi:hypothetical protein
MDKNEHFTEYKLMIAVKYKYSKLKKYKYQIYECISIVCLTRNERNRLSFFKTSNFRLNNDYPELKL